MGSPFTQSGWFIERRDTPHGNFELIFGCPVAPSPLAHYWNDNNSGTGAPLDWRTAEASIYPAEFPGPFFGAALIMSSYGNLEFIAALHDTRLVHFALVGIWGWRWTALPSGS